YCEGTVVSIQADPAPADSTFDRWFGSGLDFLNDPFSPNASLTLPGFEVSLKAVYKEIPRYFSGEPIEIPGKINLEEYDVGGEGETYHDMDANRFDVFRVNEGVDVAQLSLADYFIAHTENGEWMEYSVYCQAGAYFLEYSFASETEGYFHLELDGEMLADSIYVRNTGGLTAFNSVYLEGIELPEGEHVLRLVIDSGGFNINYIRFCESCAPYYTLRTGGFNGTVVLNPQKNEYLHGETVEITAVPDEGYQFAKWSYDITGNQNPAVLVMDGDKTVRATFELSTGLTGRLSDTDFKVYPNPAKNHTYIDTGAKSGTLQIISVSGVILKQIHINNTITNLNLNLAKGNYILKFRPENENPRFRKLIVY
ncbi:MAG: InlB B-repeat-containing protein, partial [Prolixibacteraceae bacterium]